MNTEWSGMLTQCRWFCRDLSLGAAAKWKGKSRVRKCWRRRKKIFSTSQCSACNTPLFPPTMTTFHCGAMMNTRRRRRSFGEKMMMVTLRFAWLIYKIIHKTLLKVVFSHCRSLHRRMDVVACRYAIFMWIEHESTFSSMRWHDKLTITFHILARKIDMRNFYWLTKLFFWEFGPFGRSCGILGLIFRQISFIFIG